MTQEKQKFDLVVIGAGPGGYVAAIRAAQAGKSVALIEKNKLGGTCLNVGCIPTKTLLANTAVLQKVRHAPDFGITTGAISFDYAKMKERKDRVVGDIRKSLGGLIASNKITVIEGHAEFLTPREIKISGEKKQVILADKTIIATGSEPFDIPAFPCDHKHILNSTSVLELTKLPKSIAVIGGGYIGCEFASLFAELDVKVTIFEALPAIVIAQGKTISDALTKAFKNKGIDIQCGVKVAGIDKSQSGVNVKLEGGQSSDFDLALISVGRKINTEGLGLNKAGVATGERGEIIVNEQMETNSAGIYAIGDVTGKAMLAHVASHQGIVAADHAIGKEGAMHYHAVPAVIFTSPEIATVGLTLEEAKEKGYAATLGQFPFQALGKSLAAQETEGFAQVVIDSKTQAILGAQVVGHEASALIAEMAIAINNELTLECVTETIHAHPTVAEAWLEASLIAAQTPIHFPPRRR
ncbi:MAG: dihydrolipoyl dehydrogenase [Chlamydiales bacterium]|nr:dihydrolipoyl dehydrogenase [Chlamydiales bacterium]